MDRIAEIFHRCRRGNRRALVIFTVAGFPSFPACEEALEKAVSAGADIIELGVPFSDPMADGPVIADAGRRAIEAGCTLPGVLELAERFRKRHPETGIILFSYMNVMFHYGLEALCAELQRIGVDGILAVDLPLEEREELAAPCRAHDLHLIALLAPTTPPERAARILESASGFAYFVCVRGVTGVREGVESLLPEELRRIRSLSPVPVVAGFGIGSGRTASAVAAEADGVVVGSAFVGAQESGDPEALVSELARSIRAPKTEC